MATLKNGELKEYKYFFDYEITKNDKNKITFKGITLEKVNEEIRCFYQRIEYGEPDEKIGFYFCIIQIVSFGEGEDNFHQENDAEILFCGTAYFDGIRHLYMGDEQTENYGYHYYPSLLDNIASLKVLRELEEEFCRDLD